MKLSKKLLSSFAVVILCCSLLGNSLSVNAASSFTNSTTQNQAFAVPEGGWSILNVEVTYTERYTTSGNNNTLNHRTKSVLFTRAYATSCPTISLLNVKHSNNTYFTNWISDAVMYPPSWDGCSSQSIMTL